MESGKKYPKKQFRLSGLTGSESGIWLARFVSGVEHR